MTVGYCSRHRAPAGVSRLPYALAILLLAVTFVGGCSRLRDTAVNPAPVYTPQPNATPSQQQIGYSGLPFPTRRSNSLANTITQPHYARYESPLLGQPTADPDSAQLSYSLDPLAPLPQNQFDNAPQNPSPSWQTSSATNPAAVQRYSVQLRDEPGRTNTTQALPQQRTLPTISAPQTTYSTSLPPQLTKVAIVDAEQLAWSGPPRAAKRPQVVFAPPPGHNTTAATYDLTEPAVKYSALPVTTHQHPMRPALAKNAIPTETSTISDLIRRAKTLVANEPANIPAQMALRCLLLADGQKDQAMDTKFLEQLPAEQQPGASALMQVMLLTARSQYGQDSSDPELANRALDAVDKLLTHVAQRAELTIATLKICTKVHGFARYDIIPPSQLRTGREQTVLVYCEVQNFQTELDDDGKFLSQLRAEFTLYDAQGNVRAQNKQDVLDSPTAKPRRDFFLTGKLLLPHLGPGKFHIRAQITDKIAGKISLPQQHTFEIKSTVRAGSSL